MTSVIIKGWKTACCGPAPLANLTPESNGVSDSVECSATIIAKRLDQLRLRFWTLRDPADELVLEAAVNGRASAIGVLPASMHDRVRGRLIVWRPHRLT